jgi:hypothetical protein|tara:strand:- start:260 stop:439 length:180 start_codon:yes stop_codon:yes gene_type:complete
MRVEEVHISKIGIGDTVFHDGAERTICSRVIKFGGFMGTSLFGDSYRSGRKKVKRILFK